MDSATLLLLTALAEGEGDSGTLLARLRAIGEEPSLATFYRRLKEGIDEGWVEARDATDVEGPGRPALIYRLTEAGRTAARTEAERWRAVTDRLLRGEG